MIIKFFKVIIIIIIFKYIFIRDVWNVRLIDWGKFIWKKLRLKLNFYVDDNNMVMWGFFLFIYVVSVNFDCFF